MYGGWLGPPVSPEADLSVLFTHNEGFSTMCGHGIIALVKVVLDMGVIGAEGGPSRTVGIDTPAGLVTATAQLDGGSVTSVRFRNVPSFVARRSVAADTGNHGVVSCDIAYGGAFYAFVDASTMELGPADVAELVRAGRGIKEHISETAPPRHPEDDDLSFLYGVIFVFPADGRSRHSRHVCVFADGEVDRSPTGTGVSARLALLHQVGAVSVGEEILVESIVGSVFSGRVVGTTEVDGIPAVIPEIGGTAHITGRSELWFDPDDPLGGGFFLR
jgi:proline racemase